MDNGSETIHIEFNGSDMNEPPPIYADFSSASSNDETQGGDKIMVYWPDEDNHYSV